MTSHSVLSRHLRPGSWLDVTLSGLRDRAHTAPTPQPAVPSGQDAGHLLYSTVHSQRIGTLQGTSEGCVSINCSNLRVLCLSDSAASAEEMLAAER